MPEIQHIAEGHTIMFRADQRGGKTLAMSIYALADHQQGRTIFSNLAFDFPFTPLNFYEIDLARDEIRGQSLINSTICLDETWMMFDSRSGMSKDSKRFSRFIYQTKKKGIRLYGNLHDLELLDKRLRYNFDFLIDCQVHPQNRAEGEPPTQLVLHIQPGILRPGVKPRTRIINLEGLLGLYDTTHTFDPLEKPEWIEQEEAREKEHKRQEKKRQTFHARKVLDQSPDFNFA